MTTDPIKSRGAKATGSTLRAWLGVILLIASMTAMRLIYADMIDLRTDEAYYWTWSKESVLSFLDHPPMIAWFVRFGTSIFGDTNLGVRFAGIVALLVTQLLLADIVRRVTHDVRAVLFALLMPEAALLLRIADGESVTGHGADPVRSRDAVEPGAAERKRRRTLVARGRAVRGAGAAVEIHGVHAVARGPGLCAGAGLAAALAASPYPWLAALLAIVVFSPVLIWNAQHDWASFRFQGVRATAAYSFSFRTLGDFIGLQFGLVGFVMLPVVLSGTALTAWRGYRTREPVAILLSTAVLLPFGYFLWKSTSLRVGDTWPMFLWPAGFAATAINISMLPRENRSERMIRFTLFWARTAVVSASPL